MGSGLASINNFSSVWSTGVSLVVWHLDLAVITAGIEWARVKQTHTRRGWGVGSGLVVLYLKMTSVNLGADLLWRWWRAGSQGKVAQAHYRFVHTKVCPAWTYRTDVKASNSQKLEAWLINCGWLTHGVTFISFYFYSLFLFPTKMRIVITGLILHWTVAPGFVICFTPLTPEILFPKGYS